MSGESDEESSRRRLLALLAAALLALIGAGTGVSNLFGRDDGDEEGGVDLSVDYDVTPDDPVSTPTPTPTPTPGGGGSGDDATGPPERPDGRTRTGANDSTTDGVPRRGDPDDESDNPRRTATPGDDVVTTSIPPVSVADVEPGDGGTIDLSLTLSGSSARLWVRGDVTAVDEGGTTEAERSAGDAGGTGELQEYVRVQLWYDADDDGTVSGGETVIYEGTLAGLDARDEWIALTEACVAPGTHTARFRWDLPSDAPNVVQTDGVSFSLGVAADTSGCA